MTMQSAAQTAMVAAAPRSNAAVWRGRVISTLVVLFLVFDGVTKVIKERHVIEASADLGFSINSIAWIGALLLLCTLLYVIPRMAILGAVVLTGYLGGAVAVQVRVGHPVFQCLFPVIFGALVWAGIFLRDSGLSEILPFRKS
jgi:uncharacterized membrane protein (UPF0182 family)